LLIVETDHQLSRAVAAIAQWEGNRRQREEAAQEAVEREIAAMNGIARWFSRPLLALLAGQRSARGPAEEAPAVAGLNMVLARLRRMMHEQGIERHDVQGHPFDAETMHAIGTVASTTCPPGHVAEQLSPAYRWQGQILRFADVRIADHKSQE
jgi:molecular chaperone GrpE